MHRPFPPLQRVAALSFRPGRSWFLLGSLSPLCMSEDALSAKFSYFFPPFLKDLVTLTSINPCRNNRPPLHFIGFCKSLFFLSFLLRFF